MGGVRAAIVLAAGASQRMGTPKALLPWGDSTLLAHAIAQARQAGATIVVVVLGPATRDLEVDALTVFNPDPQTGRSTSIRLGAAAIPDSVEAVLVQSVDQPVASRIVESLYIAVAGGVEIAVPTFGGRRGHPVCLSGKLIQALREIGEETQGLRAVVRRHTTTEVEVADESVVWNLNDPAAYAAARASAQ